MYLVVFANIFKYQPNIKYMHFCGFQFKYTKCLYSNTYLDPTLVTLAGLSMWQTKFNSEKYHIVAMECLNLIVFIIHDLILSDVNIKVFSIPDKKSD